MLHNSTLSELHRILRLLTGRTHNCINRIVNFLHVETNLKVVARVEK